MELKFYVCETCGNIITKVHDSGVEVYCCGKPMTEIVAGSTDAAIEKHVPEWKVDGNLVEVNVGSVDHPMAPEHFIEWVALETEGGNQIKYLHPGDKPHVTFALSPDDKVKNVYAYCNIHGLWKA